MKYLLLLFFSLPLLTAAQPYALLHRQLLNPVEVTQQLEWSNIAPQYFPVHTTDLDAMIHVLNRYIDSLDEKQNKFTEKEIKIGHSRMLIRPGDKKGQGWSVLMFTRAKDYGYTFELANKTEGKKRALQKMKAFLYYLRNNRFLVHEKRDTVPGNSF